MSRRNTVVYVESGLTGGGSFESLRQHLAHLDGNVFRPVAVFLNHTEHVEILQGMGVPVRLVRDRIYNRDMQENAPKRARWIERMAVAPHLLVPSLSRAWESAVHGPTIRAIRKVITEERAAVLHTNNQVNRDFYAIIAAHTSGVPCIAHLRSFFSFGFNRAKARYVNQAVARFVAYSPAVAEHWIRLGIERGKTEIVYNGIGALDIRPRNLHSELNLPQNRRIIGAVGKVIPERGYDWLIRAFARLVRDARDVSLVIVGGGEASRIEQLKVLANDLGVGEHVIFTGFQKRAADLIAAMDVLVLPYTIEPFGRVLLEAWSLGIPTVLTDVGGVREITNDGRASLIVPPRDEISLARAISMIISEHPLADRLTEAGKEAVATRFNMKTYAAEMERIYHDALAAEGKPRT